MDGIGTSDNNQNVDIFRKAAENNKHTNTSSSQSSSSNQSERQNLLPHYQPRWHQHLNQPMFIRNPLHPAYIKAHLDSVNHEIAQLDSRIENVLLKQYNVTTANDRQSTTGSTIYRHPIDAMDGNGDNKTTVNTTTTSSVITSSPTTSLEHKFSNVTISSPGVTANQVRHSQNRPLPKNPPPMDSDTEHIYETIPEDSESEPIYCSPYKGEEDETDIVEEWLNMHDNQKRSTGAKIPWSRTTKSNSSMEDHENSSSAYNTGGSCNSNHQLTLELNVNNSSLNDKDGSKTLVFCPAKHLQPQFPGHAEQINSNRQPVTRTTSASKKDKTISPTHEKRRSQESSATNRKPSVQNQGKFNVCHCHYIQMQ